MMTWRLRARRPPPPRLHPGHGLDRGRVVGVTGPPGAPGRTFTALNLAATCAARGVTTLLLDADPVLGTVAAHLDLPPERSAWFLAHEAVLQSLDDQLIARHLHEVGPLQVLPGIHTPGEPGQCTPQFLVRLLDRLVARFQLVVVDLGALVGPGPVALALTCDTVIWTVVATEVGAEAFDRTIHGVGGLAIATRPAGVVLNRTGRTSLPGAAADIERQYRLPVLARIPEDRRRGLRAERAHLPAVVQGAFSRPFTLLADGVLRPPTAAAGRRDDRGRSGAVGAPG
ncbi:MAG TPA: hypothetical protein VMW49_05170 [Candidatus Dormibacteraeota bacterium]|nr:hypothetical protein [Candidatus Dormibacteraeota bacterium]